MFLSVLPSHHENQFSLIADNQALRSSELSPSPSRDENHTADLIPILLKEPNQFAEFH